MKSAFAFALLSSALLAQTAQPPSVSQVIPYSQLTNSSVAPVLVFQPTATGTIRNSVLSVYTDVKDAAVGSGINNPSNYAVATTSPLISALNSSIATSLSLIPLSSPTSGVILKKDPLTGAELPGSSTLGPIFTQRAETVGKGNWYVGITYQDYHFTSLEGQSLNGLPVLYGGNDPSSLLNGTGRTAPATVNVGLDVRLSQELAFITYGVTNRFDVSVGLPQVHSSVASRTYNGVIYSGTGTDFEKGNQCWCLNTFTPGSYSLAKPVIGSASRSETGIGDLALRLKAQVIERRNLSMAIGTDFRFPTGDEANYLGTGTTSVKPFAAVSLYTKPLANGIVFAPHFDAGWQFSGKSILGGTLEQTMTNAALDGGASVNVPGALVYRKDYLPDVFPWSAGTEIAFGRRHTALVDILGNQIGTIHGIQRLTRTPIPSGYNPPQAGFEPLAAYVQPQSYGYLGTERGSYGQYSGAFGYKIRVYRDLVASFQAVVRFDSNGLTARFVPLFGLGFSR